MKKVLFAFIFAASVGALYAQTNVVAATLENVLEPVMTFEKMQIEYGTIGQGSDPLRKFKFKNTGNDSLRIYFAQGSCGCTVPTYKKEAIAPGESGEIEVRYDTNRLGPFQKSVTLQTNQKPNNLVLTIKGDVVEAKFLNGEAQVAPPANAPTGLPRN
jgi:hypothetical protein